MKNRHHIAVLVLGLSLVACGGGGGGETPTPTPTPTDPGDTTAPSLSAQLPVGRLITTSTPISLRFDESIDTTSFTLTGSLAEESDGGVWSQTDIIDDTLTITPKANWPVDTGRTLVINAKDLAGNAMAELTLTHDVYRGTLYYISAAMADDTGNGETSATARKYIHATVADVTAPATILVAEGEYRLSSAAIHNTQVVLKEGVSLYGGYNIDFTQRDPASTISRIVDHSADAGTNVLPNRAIEGNGSVTASTIIDGFTIQGSEHADSDYSTAIFLTNGASPTIQNNIIDGGSDGLTSYGMYNDDASPTVLNNTINGGRNSSGSYGMLNLSSSPTVQDNTINGGSSSINSTGMINSRSSPTILNNVISGGSANQTYGMYNGLFSSPTVQDSAINGGSGSNLSIGMRNVQSTPTLLNNTINGGSGSSSSTSIDNSSSSPDLQNNILLTRPGAGSRCYSELNDTSDPTALHNNHFVACDVLYRDEGTTDILDIDAVNTLGDISGGVLGNTYSATLSQ